MKKTTKLIILLVATLAGVVLAWRYYTVGSEDQALIIFLQYLTFGFLIYPLKDSYKEFTKIDWLIKAIIFVVYSALVFINYRLGIN